MKIEYSDQPYHKIQELNSFLEKYPTEHISRNKGEWKSGEKADFFPPYKLFQKVEKDLEKLTFEVSKKSRHPWYDTKERTAIDQIKTNIKKINQRFIKKAGFFGKFRSVYKKTEKQFEHLNRFLNNLETLAHYEVEEIHRLSPNKNTQKILPTNKQHPEYNSILKISAEGSVKDLESLIKERKDLLHAKSDEGMNLLHIACLHGNREVAEYLMFKKIRFNVPDDKEGKTPLHFAVESGKMSMVALLLRKGANLEAKDKQGRTPILIASENHQWVILKHLESQGGKIGAKDNQGKTAFLNAVQLGFLDNIKDTFRPGYSKMKDSQGNNAFHFLAMANDEPKEVMKLLIGLKVDINAKNKEGNTPLHLAIMNKKWELAKFLIDQKAIDYDAKNKKGDTPLHLAVREGNMKIVQSLTKKGADIFRNNRNRFSPLTIASSEENLKLVKTFFHELQSLNASKRALEDAAKRTYAANTNSVAIKTFLREEGYLK